MAHADVIAVKRIMARDRRTQDAARRELAALNTVRERRLEACMPGLGGYVRRMNSGGGFMYYLAMPCAVTLGLSCNQALLSWAGHRDAAQCMLLPC